MKPGSILLIIGLVSSISATAQLISRFLWSSSPLTTAANGPSGTSVSSSATSSYIGGSLGYALNPGVPTKNVDLVVPGSPYFDVSSIYIDLHFRREENQASFFKRGSLFDFGMNSGNLYVVFTTTQGSTPGDVTINSGNILSIADDHVFHRYRFAYDNNTGIARVWVDDNLVYTYNGIEGRPLSWTNAGDLIVGHNMDASGRNIPVLSNFSVQLYSASVLATHQLNFNAVSVENSLNLQWQTTDENVEQFELERSDYGTDYIQVLKRRPRLPAGSTNEIKLTDDLLPAGTYSFFRLKILHSNGGITYSRSIKIHKNSAASQFKCFPNPTSQFINLALNSRKDAVYNYEIFTRSGVPCLYGQLHIKAGPNELKIPLANTTAKGNMIIKVYSAATAEVFHATFVRL